MIRVTRAAFVLLLLPLGSCTIQRAPPKTTPAAAPSPAAGPAARPVAPGTPGGEAAAPSGADADIAAASAALQRGDKSAARKSLSRAEAVLGKAVKSNPANRAASEALGMVYFYQGEAGDKGGYERATKFLGQVIDKDPEALQATRYLAHSYARLGNAKQTVVYAGQAAAMSTDPSITKEMNDLKAPYQEFFLSSWYEHANYYDSKSAKLTQYNPKTYQLELVAQITPQFEQDLGAKGLQAITPALKMSQDTEVQKYLQKLVDRLVSKTAGPPFSYTVDVVESPQINAMAFPGRILVNTGLLKFTQSEAELVTVLSHEIGHIYAHHSARALVSDYQKRQIASGILTAAKAAGASGIKDQLLVLGLAGGLKLLELGYSRQQEKEADRYGTHIAFNAGYNPTFMTKFFLRLYEANPKQPFRLLSTHPPTPERIQYTTAYLEAFPLETEMQIDSQDFKDMKKRIK